jgi:hypothetical protein
MLSLGLRTTRALTLHAAANTSSLLGKYVYINTYINALVFIYTRALTLHAAANTSSLLGKYVYINTYINTLVFIYT